MTNASTTKIATVLPCDCFFLLFPILFQSKMKTLKLFSILCD